MNEDKLREARVELGWSRRELAERAGLTHHSVAVIEQGKRPPTESEVAALQRVFLAELGHVLVETGEHEVIQVDDEPNPRVGAWHGLLRGDEVRVVGEKGRFHFLYYFEDERQSYVQVFGPIPGSVPRSRNPRAGHERSIHPQRIAPV